MEDAQAIDFLSTLIPFTVILFIIAVGVVLLTQQFHKNMLQKQLDEEELKMQHQREVLQTTLQVQENERKRIAQDLHDELGANLSISRMQLLQLARTKDLNSDEARQNMANVQQAVETALASARRISHELMPVRLVNVGLQAALEQVAEKVLMAGGLRLQLQIDDEIEPLKDQLKIALYRICTELANNTLKHAMATSASLSIRIENCTLLCNYEDNGKGFSPLEIKKGVGLRSLEGRVTALNGRSNYRSEKGKGFSFELSIPIPTST